MAHRHCENEKAFWSVGTCTPVYTDGIRRASCYREKTIETGRNNFNLIDLV
jgi:hypothetical protein